MIYDITQPLFECKVFPGDPAPEKKILMRIADGAPCRAVLLDRTSCEI